MSSIVLTLTELMPLYEMNVAESRFKYFLRGLAANPMSTSQQLIEILNCESENHNAMCKR